MSQENVQHEGPLELLHAGKWHSYHAVLSGGGLYFYKSQKKKDRYNEQLKLVQAKLEAGPSDPKHPHSSTLTIYDKSYTIAAPTEKDIETWKQYISNNIGLEIDETDQRKKKQSRSMALKKNIASHAATSGIIQTMMQELNQKDSFTAMSKHYKNIMKMHAGKKQAKENMETLLRLMGKVYLLYQHKDITERDLRNFFRKLSELWSLQIDYIELPFAYEVGKIQSIYEQMKDELVAAIRPYISEKTTASINEVFKYIAGKDFLDFMYTDPQCEKDRQAYGEILRADWVSMTQRAGNAASPAPSRSQA